MEYHRGVGEYMGEGFHATIHHATMPPIPPMPSMPAYLVSGFGNIKNRISEQSVGRANWRRKKAYG